MKKSLHTLTLALTVACCSIASNAWSITCTMVDTPGNPAGFVNVLGTSCDKVNVDYGSKSEIEAMLVGPYTLWSEVGAPSGWEFNVDSGGKRVVFVQPPTPFAENFNDKCAVTITRDNVTMHNVSFKGFRGHALCIKGKNFVGNNIEIMDIGDLDGNDGAAHALIIEKEAQNATINGLKVRTTTHSALYIKSAKGHLFSGLDSQKTTGYLGMSVETYMQEHAMGFDVRMSYIWDDSIDTLDMVGRPTGVSVFMNDAKDKFILGATYEHTVTGVDVYEAIEPSGGSSNTLQVTPLPTSDWDCSFESKAITCKIPTSYADRYMKITADSTHGTSSFSVPVKLVLDESTPTCDDDSALTEVNGTMECVKQCSNGDEPDAWGDCAEDCDNGTTWDSSSKQCVDNSSTDSGGDDGGDDDDDPDFDGQGDGDDSGTGSDAGTDSGSDSGSDSGGTGSVGGKTGFCTAVELFAGATQHCCRRGLETFKPATRTCAPLASATPAIGTGIQPILPTPPQSNVGKSGGCTLMQAQSDHSNGTYYLLILIALLSAYGLTRWGKDDPDLGK